MIIKEENYLQYPLTEILGALPENESIIFAYNSDWYFFEENTAIAMFKRLIQGIRTEKSVAGYFWLRTDQQNMYVLSLGTWDNLINFWLYYRPELQYDRVFLWGCLLTSIKSARKKQKKQRKLYNFRRL